MAARTQRVPSTVDVNLSTTELVQGILEDAGIPVSRNWLLSRLKESGHSTTRPRLNRILLHYFVLGLAVEGSKGIQWTHNMSPQLLYAVANGKRL
jgi:hypothetical protein